MKKSKKEPKPIILSVRDENTLMNFLISELKGKSRNNIKSMLSRNDISVNNKKQKKFDYPLKAGDTVKIEENKPDKFTPVCPFEIIYEDEDLIVINKPEGLLTVATDTEKYNTAYRHLSDYVKEVNKNNKIFIVHRLDRETSGLLVFAKSQRMKEALQENWSELVTQRGYVAVVEGHVSRKSDTIKSYLKETKTGFMYSASTGQFAVTNYQVKAQNSSYSLLDIELETGRKNQIRVHLSELGHPIVGDKKYKSETNPVGRLCLHAKTLKFKNPLTDKEFSFTSQAPSMFSVLTKRKKT